MREKKENPWPKILLNKLGNIHTFMEVYGNTKYTKKKKQSIKQNVDSTRQIPINLQPIKPATHTHTHTKHTHTHKNKGIKKKL